jgi:hydroxymethylpyrimidine pyrophosphatase-like HAD family hydrolase
MSNIRPKTIFCDIDGTLVLHENPSKSGRSDNVPVIIEGTVEKLLEWDSKGYNIILVTGRRESSRESTEKQLNSMGIIYDKLIMGIGGGVRVIINDKKPDGELSCESININRNQGIKNINI